MYKRNKILEDYIRFKKTSVNSVNKIKDIERYVGKFILYFKKDLKQLNENDLNIFINELKNSFSVRSVNDIKVYLKNFIKWYYIDWSSRFRNLDKICRTEKPEKAYSPDEMLKREDIEKLVKAETHPKWKAYFLVLYYGGFRPSEVCNLKWSQISFEKKHSFIRIYSKKNKKEFYKFIPEHVTFYLTNIKDNNSQWVFPSRYINERKDLPMKEKAVYARLKHLSLKVLNRRINPYLLRHSIATELYTNDNIKDVLVANQMGHSESMKEVYTNQNLDKLKERMKKIYIKPEDLPEDKQNELLQKMEKMEKLFDLQNELSNLDQELLFTLAKGQKPKPEQFTKVIELKNKVNLLRTEMALISYK